MSTLIATGGASAAPAYAFVDKTPVNPVVTGNIRYPTLVGDGLNLDVWYEDRLNGSRVTMRHSATGYQGFGPAQVTSGLSGLGHPRVYPDGSGGYVGYFWDTSQTAPNGIMRLTSSDGLAWTGATQVTVTGTPFAEKIWGVVGYFENVTGETDVLYYTQATGANEQVYRATATDGLNFTYSGTAFANPGSPTDAGVTVGSQVVYDAHRGHYLLIWNSESIGVGNLRYATSADGQTFTNQGTVVVSDAQHGDLQETSFIVNDSLLLGVYTGDFPATQNTNDLGAYVSGEPPQVIAVDPNRGPPGGGTQVEITGQHLAGATAVTFDGIAATTYSVDSGTQITATTPAHATGPVDVTVTTPIATVTAPAAYTYADPAPAFSAAPSAVDFGNVPVGTATDVTTVTVTNTGDANLAFGPDPVRITGANLDEFATGTDTCSGAVVPPGTTCTVDVRFAPTSIGPKAADLRFTDDAAGSPQDVPLTGVGVTPAAFSATPSSLEWGDVTANQPAPVKTLTVRNTGGSNLVFGPTAVTLSGADADQFWLMWDGCSEQTLAPDQTCAVDVSFSTFGWPYVAGVRHATLDFLDNAAGSPQHIALSGRPVSGQFAVSPQEVVFGARAIGSSTERIVDVTNTRAGEFLLLTDPAATITGADANQFTITNDWCSGGALPAPPVGDPCGVGVTFTPTSAGEKQATLRFTDSDPSSPQDVPLTGTGVLAPTIGALDPATGLTTGGTPVVITGTNFAGATAVTFDGATATFTPDSPTKITATAPAHAAAGPVDVTVTTPGGTATAAGAYTYVTPTPGVAVAPANVDFGSVAIDTNSQPRTVTVTNTGNGDLRITGVTLTGAAAGQFTIGTDTCSGRNIPADSTCAVAVRFAPTSTGAKTANLRFTDNAAGSPQKVPLSGTAIAPAPGITGVLPNHGGTAGGTNVRIVGMHLTGATKVTFGGAAARFMFDADGRMLAVTPAHDAGRVAVTVTTPDGTAAKANAFTYVTSVVPATITKLTPDEGTTAGKTAVTITGANLTGATAVTFGGAAARYDAVSETRIVVTTPAHAAGKVAVKVTTPGGTAAAANAYTYVGPPAPSEPKKESGSRYAFQLAGLAPHAVVTPGSPAPGVTGVTVTGATVVVKVAPTFSGKIRQPVTVKEAGTSYVVTLQLTVPPDPPRSVTLSPTRDGRTLISWAGAGNATGYVVLYRSGEVAKRLCKVAATRSSCTVARVLGPNADVAVRSLGGDGTRSALVPARYRPVPVPVLFATIHFPPNSAKLTGKARRLLRQAADLIAQQGFETIVLRGYTARVPGSSGKPSLRHKLSLRRAQQAKRVLRERLKDVGADVRIVIRARGGKDPVGDNRSRKGRAENRRAAISLR